MRYVAYGSHLHPLQLLERIESTTFVGTSELVGWTARFTVLGEDGSGKCNLEPSASSTHVAVYDIHADDVATLERLIGPHYEPMNVDMGALGQGTLYYSQRRGREYAPYEWYKNVVLLGARYHGFPPSALERVESQRAVVDPDHVRRAKMESFLVKAAELGR